MDSSTDEKQFLELIQENRARILKVCRVYAWNVTDREDLYQEIIFQIWRSLPGLKTASHAGSWLYRIALNTSISFVRKRMSRGGPAMPLEPEQLARHIEKGQIQDDGMDEQLACLYDAIAKLNEIEKALVTLFLEDFSYQEIAEVLGLSSSNVGVMLHRAKKKLSTMMKEAACRTTP